MIVPLVIDTLPPLTKQAATLPGAALAAGAAAPPGILAREVEEAERRERSAQAAGAADAAQPALGRVSRDHVVRERQGAGGQVDRSALTDAAGDARGRPARR